MGLFRCQRSPIGYRWLWQSTITNRHSWEIWSENARMELSSCKYWICKREPCEVVFLISVYSANTEWCVLNRTLHGKGVMSPRCPSTIEFMWSEATTVGRGSAPWSAWTTQRTRTVFGTPSPPWMCAVASLVPQHSEVSELQSKRLTPSPVLPLRKIPLVIFCPLSERYTIHFCSVCSMLFVPRQTWSMLPGASMAADVIPAWNDMTQILTSGACWEICRQLEKELVWWWPVDLYTV